MLQWVLTPCTFPRPPPPWQLERTLENQAPGTLTVPEMLVCRGDLTATLIFLFYLGSTRKPLGKR